jgi:hypothetical protein
VTLACYSPTKNLKARENSLRKHSKVQAFQRNKPLLKKSGAVQFHDGTPVAEVHCAREGVDESRKEVAVSESNKSSRIEIAARQCRASSSNGTTILSVKLGLSSIPPGERVAGFSGPIR